MPNKIEDVHLKILNMIKEIKESKAPVKRIVCEYRCVFDGRKLNEIKNGKIISVNVRVKN